MANTQVLIQEMGRGYIGHALDYDAAGHGFMAVANADPANANITPVKIYRAERGQPFGTTPIATMIPNLKVDTGCVAITHTGNNLVVSVSTHAPGEAPRQTMVETYVVAGVWTTTPGFEAERGGAGGFTGSEGEPNVEIDYNEIERRIDFVVSRIVGATQTNSLVKQITTDNGQSLRQALRDDLGMSAARKVIVDTDALHASGALYARFTETTYEQVDKVLKEHGL